MMQKKYDFLLVCLLSQSFLSAVVIKKNELQKHEENKTFKPREPQPHIKPQEESFLYEAGKLLIIMACGGMGGYQIGKWYWSKRSSQSSQPNGSNANAQAQRIRQLEAEIQNLEQAHATPVINDETRRVVKIEVEFAKPENQDLRNAVNRGDAQAREEVRRMIETERRLNPLVQTFNEACPIFAAINNDYNCTVCTEDISNIQHFNTGSNSCFHFICTPCKTRWTAQQARNAPWRDNVGTCPTCRQ